MTNLPWAGDDVHGERELIRLQSRARTLSYADFREGLAPAFTGEGAERFSSSSCFNKASIACRSRFAQMAEMLIGVMRCPLVTVICCRKASTA